MMRNELLIGTLMNETINFRSIPDERVGKYGAKSASQLRFQIRATAKTRATYELRAERTVGAILWNEGITLAQVLDGPHVDMWLRRSVGDHERLRWVANVRCREKLNGSCGSTSARRGPINGGPLRQFNVGPGSASSGHLAPEQPRRSKSWSASNTGRSQCHHRLDECSAYGWFHVAVIAPLHPDTDVVAFWTLDVRPLYRERLAAEPECGGRAINYRAS